MEAQILNQIDRNKLCAKYADILPFYLNPKLTGEYDCVAITKGTHPLALFTLIPRTETNEFYFPYNQPFILENNPNLTAAKRNDIVFSVYQCLYNYLLDSDTSYILTSDPLYESDFRPFLWNAYNEESHKEIEVNLRYTGVLNLCGLDNLEKYYSGSRKRDIRYASASCKHQIIKPTIDSVSLLYEFYKENFERQKQEFTLDRGVFVDRLVNADFRQIVVTNSDTIPCYSAIISVSDEKCIYHFASGNIIGYENFASSYTIDAALRYACERNCAWFNIEGVNSPQRGSFKLSYGLVLKEYFEVIL